MLIVEDETLVVMLAEDMVESYGYAVIGTVATSSGTMALAARLDTARDLMNGARLKAIPDWLRCSFEVTDEAGTVMLTLPFSDAVA